MGVVRSAGQRFACPFGPPIREQIARYEGYFSIRRSRKTRSGSDAPPGNGQSLFGPAMIPFIPRANRKRSGLILFNGDHSIQDQCRQALQTAANAIFLSLAASSMP